jgi:hypothetical protein
MRRTVVTDGQWVLICAIVSLGTVASAVVGKQLGGYWHIIVYFVMVVLIALALRLEFETSTERRARRARGTDMAFRPGSTHTVRGRRFYVLGTRYDSHGHLTVEMQRTDLPLRNKV